MKYIKGFDGLRAFSIILVLLTHLGVFDSFRGGYFFENRMYPVFSGVTGVTVFFTLSGFLITRILFAERLATGSINLKNFYMRRFLRLLPPLLIFYTAIAILMYTGAIYATGKGFLLSFFYLYNFVFYQYYTPELGHTWSLAVEEQFYLLWPLVLFYCNTRKALLIAFGVITVCALAWYMPDFVVGWPGHYHPFKSLYNFKYGFIPAAAPIMAGCIAGIISLQYTKQAAQAIKKYRFVVLIKCLALYTSTLWMPAALLPICYILQAVSAAMFILWLFFNQDGFICKLLELKPAAYLGKISYSLYVYQGLFLTTGTGGTLFIQQFPQNLIFSLLCAVISYEFLEKRIARYRNSFRMAGNAGKQ